MAEPFNRTDAHAVYTAMMEAKHQAEERKERMPTSAETLTRRAGELRDCLDKILDTLPADVGRNYRDRTSSNA